MLKNFFAVKRSGNTTFQEFVKYVLDYMFEYGILSEEEIYLLQDKEYSKMTFGIEYPLL